MSSSSLLLQTTPAPSTDGFAVEQGPRWLAELIYGPPEWVVITLGLLAVLAFAGGAAGYWRHGLDAEVIEGILFNLTVLLAVGLAVLVLRENLGLPYVVDAGGGLAIGYAVALGLRRACYRPLLEDVLDEESDRERPGGTA